MNFALSVKAKEAIKTGLAMVLVFGILLARAIKLLITKLLSNELFV
jgi:hypothetical protein